MYVSGLSLRSLVGMRPRGSNIQTQTKFEWLIRGKVVTRAPRFSRTVPILKRLHWLPVKFCIHFNMRNIFPNPKRKSKLHIWLTYLLGRNAQNIYAPQIQIDLLFLV